MKKILKSILFLFLFFVFVLKSFAFDVNLNVDKNIVDINNNFNLFLKITTNNWWEIWVKSIKWLENFEILWKSQSQSSSSSVVIINWQTKQNITTNLVLNLILKPKKNWEFEIWPAILEKWGKQIKSNKVKIKVSWNKSIFLNNSSPNLVLQKNNSSKNNWNNLWKNIQNIQKNNNLNNDEKIENFDNVDKKNFKDNSFYLLILVLLIWLILAYLIKNKQNSLEKKQNFWENKEERENKEEKNNLWWEIDFEKKQKNFSYPDFWDENFVEKLDEIFREKIWQKYNLKNIFSQTYDEILVKIDENNKEKIKEIVDDLNKIKYSNKILDKTKILEKIKKI